MLVVMSTRYAEARVYAVPASLTELRGPAHGPAELPRHLDWGPRYVYDLEDRADLVLMYERVIREAADVGDLRTYLNAEVLRSVWSELFLPSPARGVWEERFSELAGAAA
jgi:hypothetical protein